MKSIYLPNRSSPTSRLGFGCSALMGSLSRRRSLALLETAFDQGILHFDVAPMYGFGDAEQCLGEFMKRHAGQISVTTKFGLAAPRRYSAARLARRAASLVVKRIPSLRRMGSSSGTPFAVDEQRVPFSVEQAEKALERSLRLIQTDHIDVWLLHEVTAADLGSDELLRFMESAHQSGKIGVYGVGSTLDRIQDLVRYRSQYCKVLQFEWSAFDEELPETESFRIHHRVLSDRVASLSQALAADQWSQVWSAEIGRSLQEPGLLAKLMLKAALELNPHSIILFSSRNCEHIRTNIEVADEAQLAAPALQLHRLLRGETTAGQKL